MEQNQKKRFQKLLNLSYNTFDNKGVTLLKVLGLDSNACDDLSELTFEDFYEHLYVNGIKTVEEGLVRLKNNLLKNKKYHYIHSYGKNGKSTFNRRFIFENKEYFKFIVIDFIDFQINKIGNRHSFITVVSKYYNLFSSYYKDNFINSILECINHIRTTELEVRMESSGAYLRDEYNNLFNTIESDFIKFIEEIKIESLEQSPEIKHKLQRVFKDKFSEFIEELTSRKKNVAIELLNLLLMAVLRLHKEVDKKIVFVFDNIDDVLTHSSEYLTVEILPEIDTFLSILGRYVNEKKYFIDNKVIDETSFIFTYRTANYVSSMDSIQYNPSAAARKEHLLRSPLYIISSVNATIDILKKKIVFYDTICREFNIEKNKSYEILNAILKSIDNDDKEFKYLFKLWNGNQFAFVESFKSLIHSDFKHSILEMQDLSINIKRGAFLYFIVKYYIGNGDRRVLRNSTLSAAFQYAFTNEDSTIGSSCNLLRLFLAYIINHNRRLNRNNVYRDNEDIFNRGVSFKKVLDSITRFKVGGEVVYNKEKFKELFERIFHDDIDAFDYFITCSKETEFKNGEIMLSNKKYDFSKELDLYFDNKKLDEKQISHLNSIRLYYNTNSRYFLRDIKRHFEFFSSTIQDNIHPLSYRLKIYNCKPEDGLFSNMKYVFSYTFNNDIFLKNVFNKVENTIKTVTDFYLNSIIRIFPPKQYCKESYFALDEVFLYDDLISKHITYIEKVRWAILNNTIPFEIQDEKNAVFFNSDETTIKKKALADINGRFIYWIEKYINLFNSTYYLIETASLDIDCEMDNHSYQTKKSFKVLKTKIEKIKKSDFEDFTTIIETTDERNY